MLHKWIKCFSDLAIAKDRARSRVLACESTIENNADQLEKAYARVEKLKKQKKKAERELRKAYKDEDKVFNEIQELKDICLTRREESESSMPVSELKPMGDGISARLVGSLSGAAAYIDYMDNITEKCIRKVYGIGDSAVDILAAQMEVEGVMFRDRRRVFNALQEKRERIHL